MRFVLLGTNPTNYTCSVGDHLNTSIMPQWVFLPGVYQPELAASARAVVPAVCAVLRGGCIVLCVSVGDVEAEALLVTFLLRYDRLSVMAGQPVLLLQTAQRQSSVDWLENNGSNHLKCRERRRHKVNSRCFFILFMEVEYYIAYVVHFLSDHDLIFGWHLTPSLCKH